VLRLALLPLRIAGSLAAVAAWIVVVPLLEAARTLHLRALGHRPEPVLDLELDAS
jgi:hypothetical protein